MTNEREPYQLGEVQEGCQGHMPAPRWAVNFRQGPRPTADHKLVAGQAPTCGRNRKIQKPTYAGMLAAQMDHQNQPQFEDRCPCSAMSLVPLKGHLMSE